MKLERDTTVRKWGGGVDVSPPSEKKKRKEKKRKEKYEKENSINRTPRRRILVLSIKVRGKVWKIEGQREYPTFLPPLPPPPPPPLSPFPFEKLFERSSHNLCT